MLSSKLKNVSDKLNSTILSKYNSNSNTNNENSNLSLQNNENYLYIHDLSASQIDELNHKLKQQLY